MYLMEWLSCSAFRKALTPIECVRSIEVEIVIERNCISVKSPNIKRYGGSEYGLPSEHDTIKLGRADCAGHLITWIVTKLCQKSIEIGIDNNKNQLGPRRDFGLLVVDRILINSRTLTSNPGLRRISHTSFLMKLLAWFLTLSHITVVFVTTTGRTARSDNHTTRPRGQLRLVEVCGMRQKYIILHLGNDSKSSAINRRWRCGCSTKNSSRTKAIEDRTR